MPRKLFDRARFIINSSYTRVSSILSRAPPRSQQSSKRVKPLLWRSQVFQLIVNLPPPAITPAGSRLYTRRSTSTAKGFRPSVRHRIIISPFCRLITYQLATYRVFSMRSAKLDAWISALLTPPPPPQKKKVRTRNFLMSWTSVLQWDGNRINFVPLGTPDQTGHVSKCDSQKYDHLWKWSGIGIKSACYL